jgi:hypothetical protein
MRGNCDNKEEDSNQAHPFSKVLEYKGGSDIIEGDITRVKVCLLPWEKHDVICFYNDSYTNE